MAAPPPVSEESITGPTPEPSARSTENDEGIILGRDRTDLQRHVAFGSISVIYFFYCYNFMVGIFVKPTMIYALADGGFAFTLKETETIFAIMSFATIPGTLFFGMLSAKVGKKRTLMMVSLGIAVTTYLPLLEPQSYALWNISRFATGFALGGVFGTAVPLIMDMSPQRYRGKRAAILTSIFSVAMIFGGMLYGALGDAHWKLLMYTAVIPPVFGAVLVHLNVPDDREYTRLLNSTAKQSGDRISYLSMYRGRYLWIGMAVILLSGANFTAYESFLNNATTYLKTVLGLSAATAGSIFSVQGFGQLIGYNAWGFIADRFGRKVPAIGMVLSAVFVYLYTMLGPQDVTLLYVVSALLGLCIGFSGAWGAYYTELFPRRFSALAPGISFNGGRIISTFALPSIAGIAATSAGMVGIFKISMTVFVMGAMVWAFLPETLQRPRRKAPASPAGLPQ